MTENQTICEKKKKKNCKMKRSPKETILLCTSWQIQHKMNCKRIVPSHLFEGLHFHFFYLVKLRRLWCREIRVIIPHPTRAKGDAQSIPRREGGGRLLSLHTQKWCDFQETTTSSSRVYFIGSKLRSTSQRVHWNLVSNKLISVKFHREEITKLTFRALTLRQSRGLTLQTSGLLSLQRRN